MPIYELTKEAIQPVEEATFASKGIKARFDLQRLLRDSIQVVAPDTMVIAEEFGEWEGSKRRIDLLCLDKRANLVVIELKRTEDGGHMDLQAIRYAAMVSTMTFGQVVAAHSQYKGIGNEAESAILDFLDWETADEERFAQEVSIVLVSADFSKELTTAVRWLNDHDLDIRCVRLRPYDLQGRTLLDVQQIIPLPEAYSYITGLKEKAAERREASRAFNPDFSPVQPFNQWRDAEGA